MLQSFRRVAEWFPETSTPQYGFTPTELPSPQLLSVSEDGAGLIWTVIRVVDPTWKSVVKFDEQRRDGRALIPIISDRSKAFDIVVEVIDPKQQQLIARARFDQPWAILVRPGRLLWMFEANDGQFDVRVQQISLLR